MMNKKKAEGGGGPAGLSLMGAGEFKGGLFKSHHASDKQKKAREDEDVDMDWTDEARNCMTKQKSA